MLKKTLFLQLAVLLTEIIVGTILTTNAMAGLKTFHSGLGLLAGLSAVATLYVAFKTKASRLLLGLTSSAVIFTFLAGVGGKMTETNYMTGLMVMRLSAIIALLLVAAALIVLVGSRKKA